MTTLTSVRPWATIDPAIAEVLRPTLPRLGEQTLARIAEELPILGNDLTGRYGAALASGVNRALEHFLTLLGADKPALDEQLTGLYEGFGAREDRHGRTLETLLTAYRWGARGAWAHFSAVAIEAGVGTEELVRLAEAIFAYIDELSAASTVGFAHAHSQRVGRRDVQRQQLAEALLRGEAATGTARVAELAAEAGWQLPEHVAVAIVPLIEKGSARRPVLLPPDVLVAVLEGEAFAIVPDLTLRRDLPAIEAAVPADASAYIGTVRPPDEAPLSLAHARSLARLVGDGIIAGGTAVLAEDHLPELVLHADPRLLADLTDQALARLDELPSARRDVMLATLRSWVDNQGDRLATAQDLGVHPQTVSYRMTRLDELFGASLKDPRTRLAITLAVAGLPR